MSEPIKALIGRNGVMIPYDELIGRLGRPAVRKLMASLTVVEKVHPGKPKGMGRIRRQAYFAAKHAEVDYLVVPRAAARALVLKRTVALRWFEALPRPRAVDAAAATLAIEPYAYQEAAAAHICATAFSPARVAAGTASCYLRMDAGLGKTLTAATLMARLRVPALVVVPTVGLAEQWLDELAVGLPGARCAIYNNAAAAAAAKGKKTAKVAPTAATHDVVVVVINTLRAKDVAFMEGYGLTIFDEAHELHSAENSKALWLAQTQYVLGLSATPIERKDGLDLLVPLHLGPVLHQDAIPGFDAGVAEFRGAVLRIEYAGHPDFCETAVGANGMTSAIMTVANLNRDPHRLRLVAEQVYALYTLHAEADAYAKYGLGNAPDDPPGTPPRRHGIFVFAEHREQLPAIRAALLGLFGENDLEVPELAAPAEKKSGSAVIGTTTAKPGRSVSMLRGGVARNELGCVRDAGAHVVLTTFGYSRRGISLKEMTAMVLASPRRNGMPQLNGRIRRRGSDQNILRQVVDVVDVRTALKSQSADRTRSYKALNYTVKTVKVLFSEVKVPEVKAPEIKAPDAKVPDAKAPDAKAPVRKIAAQAQGAVPLNPLIDRLTILNPFAGEDSDSTSEDFGSDSASDETTLDTLYG